MVWISNGIWNLESHSFEVRTNGRHFDKNHLKFRQKRPDFEWSGFQMVGTIAIAIGKARLFENWTIWNTTSKKSGFQMVGFQIPTVFNKKAFKITLFEWCLSSCWQVYPLHAAWHKVHMHCKPETRSGFVAITTSFEYYNWHRLFEVPDEPLGLSLVVGLLAEHDLFHNSEKQKVFFTILKNKRLHFRWSEN